MIFVGEIGQDVRRQFSLGEDCLLSLLDRSLRQSIGLLQFPATGYTMRPDDTREQIPAQAWIASDLFSDTTRFPQSIYEHGDIRPHEQSPLTRALANTLRYVQDRARLEYIRGTGFTITNTSTQVYIVGDVQSEWISYVLQETRKLFLQYGLNSEVYYMLNRPQVGAPPSFNWTENPYWIERTLANFNFIYEDATRGHSKDVGFLQETQSSYALAEALFALAGTGITTQDTYAERMKPVQNQPVYNRVGNLSTSLVLFPYQTVLSFCSAHLGTNLVDEWLEEIVKSNMTDQERERQQGRAQNHADEIAQWMEDSEIRPGTEALNRPKRTSRRSEDDLRHTRTTPLRWPSLSILRKSSKKAVDESSSSFWLGEERAEDKKARERREQEESRNSQEYSQSFKRLQDQTHLLFETFSFENIKRASRDQQASPAKWGEIALERSGAASDLFVRWDIQATQAWNAARAQAYYSIHQAVDRLWAGSHNGMDLARVYVDTYDDRLADLAQRLIDWRRAHRDRYEATLREFERLANGEWVVAEDQANIAHGRNAADLRSARPVGATAGHVADAQGPALPGMGGSSTGLPGQQQQRVGLHQHLPEREKTIADCLGLRLAWEYARVPRAANLITAGVIATPALLLSLLLLFPALASSALLTLGTLACLVLIMVSLGWGIHRFYQRNVASIQKEILKFYCYYYAHRCEMREDQLRVNALSPLRMRVQKMREQLADIRGFLTLISNLLEDRYRKAHDDLFLETNPAAPRDVYVGNGAVLQRTVWPQRSPQAQPHEMREQRLRWRTSKNQFQQDAQNHAAERLKRREKRPTNTLEDLAWHLSGKRLGPGRKASWHHPATLRFTLLRSFQDRPLSFLEMSLDDTVTYIHDFSNRVINMYMEEADLVDIGTALDSEETWNIIFERMEQPAYRVLDPIANNDLVFICGRKAEIESGERKTMITRRQGNTSDVYTNNPDWFLVARLYCDNAPAELDIDLLFPVKPAN
jgi:hypothetical protein